MFNSNQNNSLDEQRMGYMYECLTLAMKLASRHLDGLNAPIQEPVDNSFTQALGNAGTSEVIAFAFQAFKNGELTQQQYEQIMEIIMSRTVQTTARTEPSGERWNKEYLEANAFLNQCRSSASVRPGGLGA